MLNRTTDATKRIVLDINMTTRLDKSRIKKQLCSVKTRHKKACFIVLGGLDTGNIIEMHKSKMIVGRDANCDIVLRDDGISRFHVALTRREINSVTMKDLGSTNGMFVDGERVEQAVLKDGDKILFGRRTVLKFVLQDNFEQSYQRQMYESSTRDGLTGIYNRKYFSQKLDADLSFSCRYQVPFTLLMVDIDFFKKVNDTYGHRTGDDVLVAVAKTIQSSIRTEDVIARYGGEEFAILALGTNARGAQVLAERIRRAVARLKVAVQNSAKNSVQVSVSIGATTLQPGVRFKAEDVVSAADKNLYDAKNNGRNRTVASTHSASV